MIQCLAPHMHHVSGAIELSFVGSRLLIAAPQKAGHIANAFNSGNKSFHRLRAPSRSPMLMLHRCIALLAACYLVKSYCDAMHTFFDVVARSTSLVITDNAAAQNN